MPAFNQNQAAAVRFFKNVGGFGQFNLDRFDTFIVDEGLADDPGTSDTKSPAYKGFVQQRSTARGKINKAARLLSPGEAFDIRVVEPGVTWELVPWENSAEKTTRNIAKVVRGYAENKTKELLTLRKHAEEKLRSHAGLGPGNTEALEQLVKLQGIMMGAAIKLESRVIAETARYDAAFEFAKVTVAKLTSADNATALELLDHDDDDDDGDTNGD